MANPAFGIALGGAARAFREADRLDVQREAITSRERIAEADQALRSRLGQAGIGSREGIAARGITSAEKIAEGVQTGQTERARLNIDAAESKRIAERAEAGFIRALDGAKELRFKMGDTPSPVDQATFTKNLAGLKTLVEASASNLEKLGKPQRAAQMRSLFAETLRSPGLGTAIARAEGSAAGTAGAAETIAFKKAGGIQPAAEKAGALQRAKEAEKQGPGAKALDKIAALARRTTEVDEALRKDPTNQTLLNEKKFLDQEFDQPTVAGVLVPLIRKVLDGKELSEDEQKALDVIRNTSGFNIFMRDIFGGDVLGGSPVPAVTPPAAELSFEGLSKPIQDLVNQAKEAIEGGKDLDAVKETFLKLGGSEQVFSQFVLSK